MGQRGYGQEKEHITAKQLEEVVDIIEDPNKRAVFVNNLKNLIQAKEEAALIGTFLVERKPERLCHYTGNPTHRDIKQTANCQIVV